MYTPNIIPCILVKIVCMKIDAVNYLQDDPKLFDYNVDDRVDAFIKDILLQAGNYRTDHIMFTFGSDFQYENAIENYKNIDKLMKYTMEKVHIIMYYVM